MKPNPHEILRAADAIKALSTKAFPVNPRNLQTIIWIEERLREYAKIVEENDDRKR